MIMRVSLTVQHGASFQKIVVLFSFFYWKFDILFDITFVLPCLKNKSNIHRTRIGIPYTNRNNVHESEHSMVVFSQKSRFHGW